MFAEPLKISLASNILQQTTEAFTDHPFISHMTFLFVEIRENYVSFSFDFIIMHYSQLVCHRIYMKVYGCNMSKCEKFQEAFKVLKSIE